MAGRVFRNPPEGLRGFDTNSVVTAAAANAFVESGYRFCVRYVRRQQPHDHDLSSRELATLLAAGLGVMAVQHVARDGWTPTARDGAIYGSVAAADARAIGLSSGVTLWCDLEGVALGTPARQIIEYCNHWYAIVAHAGYVPGLYVGFRCGLTSAQLYHALRFKHYWGAYNISIDEEPAVRGVQMKQTIPAGHDLVHGADIPFQVDILHIDALGGRPSLMGVDDWLHAA